MPLEATGVIVGVKVGKLADLAVPRDDPFTVPLRGLWKTPVESTMVEGEAVHQA